MIIDSHSHIQFKTFGEEEKELIKRTLEKGVWMNTVGTQSTTSRKAVEIAEKYEGVFATIGVHPTHVFSTEVEEEGSTFKSRSEVFDYEFFKELAKSPKVIGIGETGMDGFHIPKNLDKKEVFVKQKEVFLLHYKLAQEMNLPLVIHVRDAHEELIEVLGELPKPIRGVAHCYTSDWENAQKYLDFGLYLGFTGIVTFPPKKTDPQSQLDLLEVVKNCPLDKMLVETDAPFLAPQKYRGKKCEPWMVEEVVKFIAEFRGIDEEEFKAQVLKNTKELFNIK